MSFTHTPSNADYATHFYGANHTAWMRVVKPDHINTLCEQNFANPPAVLMIDDPTLQPIDLILAQAWSGVAIHRAAFCDLERQGGWTPNVGPVTKAFDFIQSSMCAGKNIIICSAGNDHIATAFLLAAKTYDRQSRGQERPVGQSIEEIMIANPLAAPNLRTLQLIGIQQLSFARDTIVKSCFEHPGMLRNLMAAASTRWKWIQNHAQKHKPLESNRGPCSACHALLKRKLANPALPKDFRSDAEFLLGRLTKPSKIKPTVVIRKIAVEETIDPRSRKARALARAPR